MMEKEVETIEVILYKVTRGKVKSHILPVLGIMVSTITTPSTLAARSHQPSQYLSLAQPPPSTLDPPRSTIFHYHKP